MAAINWHAVFFLLAAIIACGFALAVVLASNIVRMAVCLVVSLSAVAALFFLAGADFVGATQLMVYVGGTLVLLVFGVMLTARGPSLQMQSGGGPWIMATIVGASLLAVLLQAALSVKDWTRPPAVENPQLLATAPTVTPLGMGLLGIRTDQAEQKDPTLRKGMSGYLLPFEIISVHLVVVLIGAAYLARTKRRRTSPPATPDS